MIFCITYYCILFRKYTQYGSHRSYDAIIKNSRIIDNFENIKFLRKLLSASLNVKKNVITPHPQKKIISCS